MFDISKRQKLNVTFSKFNSQELGSGNETSLDFIPTVDELQLDILSPSQLFIVGLYPEFLVQEIRPSLLSKFPQEAISALLSFIAALTGMFLPRLFTEDSHKT